jgi:hypothetical protein
MKNNDTTTLITDRQVLPGLVEADGAECVGVMQVLIVFFAESDHIHPLESTFLTVVKITEFGLLLRAFLLVGC